MGKVPSFKEILSINKKYKESYRELFPNSKLFGDPCISPFEPLPYYNPNESLNKPSITITVHRYPKSWNDKDKKKESKHYDMDLYVLCPICELFEPDQRLPGNCLKPTKMIVDQGRIVELDANEPIFYNLLNYDYEAHICNEHGIDIHTKYLPVALTDSAPSLTSTFKELDLSNRPKRDKHRDYFFRQLGLVYTPKFNFSDRISKTNKHSKKVSIKLTTQQESILNKKLEQMKINDTNSNERKRDTILDNDTLTTTDDRDMDETS